MESLLILPLEGQEIDRARRALCVCRLKVSDREDPFAAVIRCTADPAKADKRTRSSVAAIAADGDRNAIYGYLSAAQGTISTA
jgi:hypothetical protein